MSDFPLIGIVGSRGKSTVAWMLDAMIRDSGLSVGAWLSNGVYANGERLEGELGPWTRVLLATKHHELDVAIQEMAAPTVVGVGLPSDAYPLIVATTICGNHESCLLAEETRIVRRALRIALNAVRADGAAVASADDFAVMEALDNARTRKVLFAMRRENPALQRHLRSGGEGAWVADGWIVHGANGDATPILPVEDVAATLTGTLIFQIQNALAAVASAMELGIPVEAICSGLRRYAPNPGVQPAACNIVAYNGATIVIDSPRQTWSLRMLMRGIRNLPRRRTMVVSGAFPALPLDDVAEAGRLLGGLGAFVALHSEGADEERLQMLRAGIASAPLPPLVTSLPSELQAIDLMLNRIGDEDVAVVLATDPELALRHLWPAPVISAKHRMPDRTVR